MKHISPFPANTLRERDISLTIARATARDIRRKLEVCTDPKYTPMDPVFLSRLEEILDEYTVEINRLVNQKFLRSGV